MAAHSLAPNAIELSLSWRSVALSLQHAVHVCVCVCLFSTAFGFDFFCLPSMWLLLLLLLLYFFSVLLAFTYSQLVCLSGAHALSAPRLELCLWLRLSWVELSWAEILSAARICHWVRRLISAQYFFLCFAFSFMLFFFLWFVYMYVCLYIFFSFCFYCCFCLSAVTAGRLNCPTADCPAPIA